MSYASLAAPALPVIEIPLKAIHGAAVILFQSLGVAATLWLLLAAPGFVTDRTALGTPAPATASR
jgi:hypothetical protein